MEKLFSEIDFKNLFLLIAVCSLFLSCIFINRVKKNTKLYSIDKNKKVKKNKKEYLKTFKKKLEFILITQNKEKHLNLIYLVYIVANFSLFLFLLMKNSLILSILSPLLIHFMFDKILNSMIISVDSIVQRNFTELANHMIKVFSKTNDVSVVLYETSFYVEEPIKNLLLKMTRELSSNNTETGILKFMNELDNLWIHAFLLTLLNYKRNSSKENVIENLLSLSEIVSNKQELTSKMISDRKPVVIINYMLAIIGCVLLVGNFALNPIMGDFMFNSILGNFSFLSGIFAVLFTILMNVKLIKP